jgi:hypothetical protein
MKGEHHKIYKYNGILLKKTHNDPTKDMGCINAKKLLSCMQADYERAVFQLEKYTGYMPTDVIPYLYEWLEVVKAKTRKPATIKDYKNSIDKHQVPFFQTKPACLHEINNTVLMKLLNSIDREGKGRMNVMYCLHRCLTHAWRDGKIEAVPPFPEKADYNLIEKPIEWLPEERQDKVIRAIPEEHQFIFWWLKYHLRRIGEGCALHKIDYDRETDSFTIRRTFSARVLVETTKTKQIHYIPCHSDFKPIMKEMPKTLSPL